MNLIKKVKKVLLVGNERSVKAKKNILLAIFLKGAGVLIGFIYFPLSLDYLGAIKFGIFLTLLSIIDWFINFDIGIGKGLINKFGEAVASKDDEKALHYVSTAYCVLGAIVLCIVPLLVILNLALPWPEWLNVPETLNKEVKILGVIIIIAFGIRFIAANIYELFFALQHMAYVEFFSLITKASFLVLILIIPYFVADSLLLFGTARSLTFALVPFFVGLYFFGRKFKKYRPSLKYFKKNYFKDLFSLGIKFFLIKISMLVIHQTNNILIASFVSLQGVPQYEAAYKYLSVFMMLFVILNNQLWPSNIDAYSKGEIGWMRKSMKAVLKIWLFSVLMATIMVLISPWVYEIWLQENIHIPIAISITVAVSICLTTWVNMHNLILNGTGKITLQMGAWILAAVINIPASLFFAKIMNLGVIGIVLGTITSLIPLAIISPVQVRKILLKKEYGIWAK